MKHISLITKTPQQAQLSTNAKYVALLEIMTALTNVNRAVPWKAFGLPGGTPGDTGGDDTGGGLGGEV